MAKSEEDQLQWLWDGIKDFQIKVCEIKSVFGHWSNLNVTS